MLTKKKFFVSIFAVLIASLVYPAYAVVYITNKTPYTISLLTGSTRDPGTCIPSSTQKGFGGSSYELSGPANPKLCSSSSTSLIDLSIDATSSSYLLRLRNGCIRYDNNPKIICRDATQDQPITIETMNSSVNIEIGENVNSFN